MESATTETSTPQKFTGSHFNEIVVDVLSTAWGGEGSKYTTQETITTHSTYYSFKKYLSASKTLFGTFYLYEYLSNQQNFHQYQLR